MGLFLSFSIIVPFKNVYYHCVFLDLFKGRRYISFELEPQLGTSCTLQHVRWAYLLVHGYGQSEGPGAPALELELPSHVWFLWPLFLARPTPEAPDAALLRHNKAPRPPCGLGNSVGGGRWSRSTRWWCPGRLWLASRLERRFRWAPRSRFGARQEAKALSQSSPPLRGALGAMSVLVIGAAGAVGKRLIKALAARGERIVAVDRAPELPDAIRDLVTFAAQRFSTFSHAFFIVFSCFFIFFHMVLDDLKPVRV